MLYNLDGDGQLGEIVMADFGDAHVHDMTLTPQQATDDAERIAHTRKSAHFTYPSCCDNEGGVRPKPKNVACHPLSCIALYAAPEVKARPRLGVAGKHADSYTVGAMLIHLVDGQPCGALEWVGRNQDFGADYLDRVRETVVRKWQRAADGHADEIIIFTLTAVLRW
jgi:hypothetical protein